MEVDSPETIVLLRYTLQYTYPYAYYMESCPRKHLVTSRFTRTACFNSLLSVRVSTSSTRSRDRKFKLEDWTRWDHWQGRPGEPDGHRRETEVSRSLECLDMCLTFSFSGQVSSVIFYSSEFSIWIIVIASKLVNNLKYLTPFTVSPILKLPPYFVQIFKFY